MKYIDAIKGSIISIFLFAPLVIFIHGTGPTPIIETILTVSSFLFAILAGLLMSRLNSRYNEIRELISIEDAHFLSLFEAVRGYGKNFSDRMANIIEKYYIISFENELGADYKQTMLPFKEMYKVLHDIKKKSWGQ